MINTSFKLKSFICSIAILAIILLPYIAQALNIEDKLENPTLEQQAQETFLAIRCMVCAGESIADSRADLAKDLRAIVRQKIKDGYSEKQVLDYVSQRYGETILMRPPLEPNTYLLWFGPIMILLAGAGIMIFVLRKGKPKSTQ